MAEARSPKIDSLRREMEREVRRMAEVRETRIDSLRSLRRRIEEEARRMAEAHRPNVDSLRREMQEQAGRMADMDSLMRRAREAARREAERTMQPVRAFRNAVRGLLSAPPRRPEIGDLLAKGPVAILVTLDVAADGTVRNAVVLQAPEAFRAPIVEAAMKMEPVPAWSNETPTIGFQLSAEDLGY